MSYRLDSPPALTNQYWSIRERLPESGPTFYETKFGGLGGGTVTRLGIFYPACNQRVSSRERDKLRDDTDILVQCAVEQELLEFSGGLL